MFHAAIENLINWISQHKEFAGVLVFLIATLESLAVIGTLIPGTVLMTAIGVLLGMGLLDMRVIFLWGIAGAILGDSLSYAIGYRYRDSIHSIWPFTRFPKLLESGKKFFHRHGGKSIFLGRFVGPIRAITPLIAGTMRLNVWRFLIADIISATLWAPGVMIPGIFLGAASMELPHNIAIYLILTFFLAILLSIFILWLIRHFYRSVAAALTEDLNQLWAFLQSKPRLHWLCFMLKYHDDHQRGQLSRALALTLLILMLGILTMNVHFLTGLTTLNQPINYFFQTIRGVSLDKIMVVITLFGQWQVLIPTIVALAMWLYYRGYKKAALHCLLVCVLASISGHLLKHWIHFERPTGVVEQARGFSFPSGHTTLATAIYGFISYLIAKRYHYVKQRLFYLPFLIIVFLIAVSRLYLDAHWFTDVLGGFLLGLISMQLTIFSYRRITIPHIRMRHILIAPLIALGISIGLYGHSHQAQLLKNSALKVIPLNDFDVTAWWNNPKSLMIPSTLNNRLGHPIPSLNLLQWVGSTSTIKTRLEKDGWEMMSPITWKDFLDPHELSLKSNHLVVFSRIFEYKKPTLILTKKFENHPQIILSLWETNYRHGDKILWVGTAEYRLPMKEWLKPKAADGNQQLLLFFEKNLPATFEIKKIDNLILIKNKRS